MVDHADVAVAMPVRPLIDEYLIPALAVLVSQYIFVSE